MNDLAALLRSRRMVRRYDPGRAVDPAAVDAVLAVVGQAPSAGRTDAVRLLAMVPAEFWSLTTADGPADAWLRGMRTAPVVLTVWTSELAYRDRYDQPDKEASTLSGPWWWIDAGMVVMAALLQATDLELGSCFFGVLPDRVEGLRSRLGLSTDRLCVGAITVGHPAT